MITLLRLAYQEGKEAYEKDVEVCPYDYDTEYELWSAWCDGHMGAYCIGEGK